MAIASNFPSSRPSLLLDFANVGRLDPRVTFARASTARYYDGVTTAKAEENLLLQSQDFTTTWVNVRSTDTANTEVAPDGTTTADSVLQEAGETAAGLVQQLNVSTNAGDVVMSVFAKPNGKNWLILREDYTNGSTRSTWFDVSTGAVGTTAAEHTASIVASTNGFYRCIIKSTANASRSTTVRISVADTDGSTVVADDGNGLYLWGAQLEQRSAVTAYTATTTQPITNYVPVLLTAQNNEARFDHTPTTGAALGLEIEEQRTNLQVYSQEFDNAAWSKTNSSITSNTVVAPDGTLTGDKLVEDTATGEHAVGDPFSFTSGTTYTGTIYAKKAERTLCRFGAGNSATWGASVIVDLSNGTITSTVAGSGTVADVGNGWYRISVTGAALATASTNFSVRLVSTGTTISYTGDGYSGIFLWGAQLEEGAFPTSYIPTTSASVTRSADAASMTGTNFSEWFNAAEGTIFASSLFLQPLSTTGSRIVAISDNTNNNRLQLSTSTTSGGNVNFLITDAGVAQANPLVGSISTAGPHKSAGAYATNSVQVAANGTLGTEDTSATIPTNVNVLNLGTTGNPNTIGNLWLQRIAYYPVKLSSAQLQALTG